MQPKKKFNFFNFLVDKPKILCYNKVRSRCLQFRTGLSHWNHWQIFFANPLKTLDSFLEIGVDFSLGSCYIININRRKRACRRNGRGREKRLEHYRWAEIWPQSLDRLASLFIITYFSAGCQEEKLENVTKIANLLKTLGSFCSRSFSPPPR